MSVAVSGLCEGVVGSGTVGEERLVKGGVIGRSSVSEESKRGEVCRDRRPSEDASSGDKDWRLSEFMSQGTGERIGVIGVDVEWRRGRGVWMIDEERLSPLMSVDGFDWLFDGPMN